MRQYVHHRTLRSYRLNVVHCRSVIFLPCLLRAPNLLLLPHPILFLCAFFTSPPNQIFLCGKKETWRGRGEEQREVFYPSSSSSSFPQFHISVFFAFVSMLPSVIFFSGGRIQTAVESPLCDHYGWLSRAVIPCRIYFQGGSLYSTQVGSQITFICVLGSDPSKPGEFLRFAL